MLPFLLGPAPKQLRVHTDLLGHMRDWPVSFQHQGRWFPGHSGVNLVGLLMAPPLSQVSATGYLRRQYQEARPKRYCLPSSSARGEEAESDP